jgi:AcrR family transcriptional regulator
MPKLVDTQARQRLVAEATLALIRHQGPAAATQRGVAREAGISLSSLQINWPTRDRLLDHAVGWVCDVHERRFREALFRRRSRDAGFLAEALLPSDVEVPLDRAWSVLSGCAGLSLNSTRAVELDRRGRRVQCHETLLDMGAGGSEDLNEAVASLLAVVDGLFVARCDTVDQIGAARALHVIAETLERLCPAARVASGGPPG